MGVGGWLVGDCKNKANSARLSLAGAWQNGKKLSETVQNETNQFEKGENGPK